MSGHRIRIKGFKLDSKGQKARVARDPKRWDVSTRMKKAGAQKVRYGKKGAR